MVNQFCLLVFYINWIWKFSFSNPSSISAFSSY